MRVLLVSNDFPTTHDPGAGSWVSARMAAMARRPDLQVHAAALSPLYPRRLAPIARPAGVVPADPVVLADTPAGRMFREVVCPWTSIDVGLAWPRRAPARVLERAASALAGHVLGAAAPYDVVHAHGMHDVPAGEVARRVALRFDLPLVVSVHATDAPTLRQAPQACASALQTAAATIYPSRALVEAAAECGLPTAHAHVVPEGVDAAIFHPTRRTWRLTTHGLRLLFVGDLDADHGADRLPRLMTRVRRRAPDARLEVVGEGRLRSRLERAMPDTAFHGSLEEPSLAEVMRGCDVLMLPGVRASRPGVVRQAYAVGVPVVAADAPGLAEVLVPGTDVVRRGAGLDDRFADAVLRACDATADPSGLVAHACRWTWERVVDAEIALLASVAREARTLA